MGAALACTLAADNLLPRQYAAGRWLLLPCFKPLWPWVQGPWAARGCGWWWPALLPCLISLVIIVMTIITCHCTSMHQAGSTSFVPSLSSGQDYHCDVRVKH